MPDVSVIICTRNPRPDYLRRVLNALKVQTLPPYRWELLLIDNASDSKLADEWDLSWHNRARHIREDDLGLTPARLRGIREARGELLVFVDDDNVISRRFLENAFVISKRNPDVTVFGAGVLDPEFEEEPPPLVSVVSPTFAPRRIRSPHWSNNPKDSYCTPWGAGLCVTRKTAWEYLLLVDRIAARKLLDRQGDQLFSHGDIFFSWTAALLGQSFGIFPELQLVHLIAKKRVEPSYIVRLIGGTRFSHCILHYLMNQEMPRRLDSFRMVQIFLHGLRRGIFSMRCHLAAEIAQLKARRVIAENELRPLRSSIL